MGVNPDHVDDLSTTFPYVALPKWLNKRASMYEKYLELASKKIPPKRLGLTRIARACIALYVKYATGRIYCVLRHSKVSTTLDLYSQAIDSAKLEAQEDIALAITSTAAAD